MKFFHASALRCRSERNKFPCKNFFVLMGAVALLATAMARALPQQSGAGANVQQIEHFPATSGITGQPLKIEARVIAPGRAVVYLRLYYKSNTEAAFKFVDMRPAAPGYVGQIPASSVRVPVLQYFLVALLSDRAVVNYPARNPFGQPIEVAIRENTESRIEGQPTPQPPAKSAPAGNKPPAEVSPRVLDKVEKMDRPVAAEPPAVSETVSEVELLILSPEPNSTMAAGDVVISASFMTATAIDSASIRILLDGKNVTPNAEVSPVVISFTPTAINAGEHTVAISARDESGRAIGPVNWRFRVAGPTNQTIETAARKTVEGVVYAESRREKFNGITLNNNNVGADLFGKNSALQYSASAYFTSLEDAALQPRHRFTLNAGLPWLKVTLGDATPYYDELLLWGRRVRGIQAGINTGWVNFDIVTGETVRQVDPLYVVVVDSLTATKTRQRFGTFKQSLLGLRPSFGNRNGFLLGFTLLKIRDDKNSLPVDPDSVKVFGRTTPRDNLVAGADVSLALDRRRLEIKASGAWSLLTNDISAGSASQDNIKNISDVDLPFDPKKLESWFILNESTTPLDPRGKTSLAYQVTLNLNYFNHFINAGYKRLGAEYLSLAQSFLRNDIRGFFISDRWRMLRNRVYLNAGLESYEDQFNNAAPNPATRLNTVQLGVSIFWEPNLPSFNFSFRNNDRNNNIDTTQAFAAEDNATRDLSFTLNYDFTALSLEHALMLNLTNSDRVDNATRALAGDAASNLKTISLRSRFQAPLTGTLTFTTNDNNIAGGQSLFNYKMFSGRVDYDFSQKRTLHAGLQARTYGAFSRVSASGGTRPIVGGTFSVVDYTQTGFQFGGALQYREQHELTLDINLLNYADRGINTVNGVLQPNPSFKNNLIRAYYAFRF